MLEDPQKFSTSNFQKILKKKSKSLFWDLSILDRNKVMSFGELSPDPVETADRFMVGGP